jgi:ATP synthase protein I
MFQAVLIQAVAVLIASALAGLTVGLAGAISAALGGAASVVPNLLFAIRLKWAIRRPGAAYAANFFLGELLKVAATIVLLAVAAKSYPGLHWLSLLAGLALALYAGLFLAFFKRSTHG